MRLRPLCSLLPLLFVALTPGCCTWLTTDYATHTHRFDTVRHIERAVATPDGKLVVQVQGCTAESTRQRPLTITVPLPTNEDGVYVEREGVTEGWNTNEFQSANALPVALAAPVVLPAYHSIKFHQEQLPVLPGAKRTLYLIRYRAPDVRTSLFYITTNGPPQRLDIYLDGRDVRTPRRYPLLIFVPVTLAVDVATFPFQIYGLSTYGERPPSLVVPIPIR